MCGQIHNSLKQGCLVKCEGETGTTGRKVAKQIGLVDVISAKITVLSLPSKLKSYYIIKEKRFFLFFFFFSFFVIVVILLFGYFFFLNNRYLNHTYSFHVRRSISYIVSLKVILDFQDLQVFLFHYFEN